MFSSQREDRQSERSWQHIVASKTRIWKYLSLVKRKMGSGVSLLRCGIYVLLTSFVINATHFSEPPVKKGKTHLGQMKVSRLNLSKERIYELGPPGASTGWESSTSKVSRHCLQRGEGSLIALSSKVTLFRHDWGIWLAESLVTCYKNALGKMNWFQSFPLGQFLSSERWVKSQAQISLPVVPIMDLGLSEYPFQNSQCQINWMIFLCSFHVFVILTTVRPLDIQGMWWHLRLLRAYNMSGRGLNDYQENIPRN